MTETLAFLAALGCHPTASVEFADRTYYQDGRIYLAADRAELWIHEGWHDCQYQKRGPATTREEWEARERDARRVELLWRER